MRTSHRLLAVIATLALAAGVLTPATAIGASRSNARTVRNAIVRGADRGTGRRRPVSFDVFSRRSRSRVAAGPASLSLRAPAALFGFDGLADLDGFVPSDTTGALGNDFFVSAVNTSFEVFALSGTQAVARTALPSMHPDAATVDNFDPKVVYDHYADVFLIIWLGQSDAPRRSFIFTTAIPDATATDPATWCTRSLLGDQVLTDGATWGDYPGLGFTDTRVTITTNQFTFPVSSARFRSAQVITIDKTGLYDCTQTAPTPVVFAGTQTLDANGVQAFTLQPAETVGTPPADQMLLSFEFAGKLSYLTVWRIKSTAAGFQLKKATLLTGKKTPPLPGTQAGGGQVDLQWDAGDGRLISAFYDADRNAMFAAHSVLKDLRPDTVTGRYLETVVAWYEVDPATKLKNSLLARQGTVGAPEVDTGWPSVATDGTGNLFVTYSRASAPQGEFLSAWVSEIPPGSTKATQLLLQPGLATYDFIPGIERWGDYTAISRNPVDASNVATFNQYAASAVTWQQVVNVVADP